MRCNELRDAVLYSTLQPCGMCTMASIWAKVGRIVYGAGRDDVHEMYFEDRHLSTENFIRDAFHFPGGRPFGGRMCGSLRTAGSGRGQGSAVQSLITGGSTGSFAQRPCVPTSIEWPSGSRRHSTSIAKRIPIRAWKCGSLKSLRWPARLSLPPSFANPGPKAQVRLFSPTCILSASNGAAVLTAHGF